MVGNAPGWLDAAVRPGFRFDRVGLIGFAVLWGIWATFAGRFFLLLILMLGLGGFLLLHTAASFFWLTSMPTNSLDPRNFTSPTWAAKPTTGAARDWVRVHTKAAMLTPQV